VLRQRIDVLGNDLLVVAEEYAMFENSRRRVDLLALDCAGTACRTARGGRHDRRGRGATDQRLARTFIVSIQPPPAAAPLLEIRWRAVCTGCLALPEGA
jgi:hypothetical protein